MKPLKKLSLIIASVVIIFSGALVLNHRYNSQQVETDTEETDSTDSYTPSYDSSDDSDSPYTEEELEAEPSAPSDSNSTIDKQAVYDFMKSKYDEITNYGENYDPDVHDPLVAQLAADQFGISESEAGQIYVDMEMGLN